MRPFRSTVLLSLIFVWVAAGQITLNPIPTRVIGKLSTKLNSIGPNLVEGREFFSPVSVAIDTSTTQSPIYVSDTGNNRVLGFRNAAAFTNGQFADIVIGQVDFTATLPAGPAFTSRTTGMAAPTGMSVDASGNLYVVDSGNNRILRFRQPFLQTGTVLPDLVIGQPDFTTGTANRGGLSATSLAMAGPSGITFDTAGNLWVADAGNNRILRFNASVLGSTAASGPAADLVLAQASFTVNSTPAAPAATSFSSIFSPTGIAFDSAGRLFVSESVSGQRGRVLVWFPPFSTGQLATRMLGVDQENPPPPPISQYQFQQSPSALFAVGNQIGVSDTLNHRLLLFPPVEQWNLNNFFQAAVTVIGQPDFASGTANQGLPSPGPSTLASPVGAVFYNSSLYVADAANSRVLVLPKTSSGFGPATAVLGQTQLTLNSPNMIEGREFEFTAGSQADAGIAVDFSSAVPHLYISDPYNNRVLGYYDLRNIQPGQYADIVIGQPDFLHAVSNYPNKQPTANNLSSPTGLVVDPAGNLYVADSGNGRVLRFHAPFADFKPGTPKAITQAADLLLGQINFTTKISDATAQTMGAPYGLAFAGTNGLLVSDISNNRVLFFPGRPENLTNGQAASIVFGQTDMFSSGAGSALNQMKAPRHIAVDSDDRLYVADSGNGRVLIFNRAPTAGNGAPAALTLTTGLSSPRGVDVNPVTGDIWVADAGTNGALRYPSFSRLIGSGNYSPNATLSDYAPLAVAEDNWGNVFVADASNRVLIYYPGLSALNAANYWGLTTNPQRPLAPGLIAALYSTGGSGQFGAGSESATKVPLPKELNGIKVLLNDTPAALFYAGPDQINFEVPVNAPQSGTADLLVLEAATGRVLGDTTVVMYSVSPGIFTQHADGIGDGVIANEDGTLNTAVNPAKAGSVVTIYMTGQGYISGMPADGDISNKALSTAVKPLVYIGGTDFVPESSVLYSGLAPTLVGVWQINVRIPKDVITLPNAPTQVVVVQDSLVSGGGGVGRPVFVYVKAP